jgi:hypothetical protein
MKFGAMVVPRASDWWLFAELEQMSYDSAWVPDSQTIYSDTYALLALGAANTSRIRLGPGVADAQVTAALRDFDPAYVSSGYARPVHTTEGPLSDSNTAAKRIVVRSLRLAECFGGFQIDHQLVFGRRLHGRSAGFAQRRWSLSFTPRRAASAQRPAMQAFAGLP